MIKLSGPGDVVKLAREARRAGVLKLRLTTPDGALELDLAPVAPKAPPAGGAPAYAEDPLDDGVDLPPPPEEG